MSKTHSPTIFNGVEDNFYDPNFTIDINKRMRVPKSIRVSGDYTDDDISGMNGSTWNQAIPNEKFEMNVPDRILVVGKSIFVFILYLGSSGCKITTNEHILAKFHDRSQFILGGFLISQTDLWGSWITHIPSILVKAMTGSFH